MRDQWVGTMAQVNGVRVTTEKTYFLVNSTACVTIFQTLSESPVLRGHSKSPCPVVGGESDVQQTAARHHDEHQGRHDRAPWVADSKVRDGEGQAVRRGYGSVIVGSHVVLLRKLIQNAHSRIYSLFQSKKFGSAQHAKRHLDMLCQCLVRISAAVHEGQTLKYGRQVGSKRVQILLTFELPELHRPLEGRTE